MNLAVSLAPALSWGIVASPLSRADETLARFDERLARADPALRAGVLGRADFADTCAALWNEGELVHLEDLVLHDAEMDQRAPTPPLTRAHAVLRARRLAARRSPAWALSPAALPTLRGHERRQGSTEMNRVDVPSVASGQEPASSSGPVVDGDELDLAAIDALLARTSATLAKADRLRSTVAEGWEHPEGSELDAGLIYDKAWDEAERLDAWRADVAAASGYPALLAAALAFEAWLRIGPLQHQDWLGALFVGTLLRERSRTPHAGLLALHLGRRIAPYRRSRFQDLDRRIVGFLEAVAAAAAQGSKDLDRLALAREVLGLKLKGRRSTSHLPELVNLLIAKPIVTIPLVARELKVSAQGAQGLMAQIGGSVREVTGRGRYRAWSIT